MRKIGAFVGIAALGTLVLASSPAAAFHLGPFHFGWPFFHLHRHHHYPHHSLYMHANPRQARPNSNDQADPREAGANPYDQAGPRDTTRAEAAAARITSPLLYPGLALPTIVENIFFPTYSAPWPFGYQAIFTTAFSRAARQQGANLCQPTIDPNVTVGRLSKEITPTAEQTELLQRLGGAIGAASGYLAKSCPTEIPAQPVARLRVMESQIQYLAMAVDIIRQPLQEFEQSLSEDQAARFVTVNAAQSGNDRPGRSGTNAAGCGGPTPINRSVNEISRSVQPSDGQREALDEVKQAFTKAAGDLEAHCPSAVPPTAVNRLEMIESRLDSTWRAMLSIQVALASFETKLNDEQKGRFETMNFASR